MTELLALSDVVTLRALERAFSRGISGDARNMAVEEGLARHEAYRRFPIPTSRQTHALTGAFDLLPELATRWDLPVPPTEWEQVLDRYIRDLLGGRGPHNLNDLGHALGRLGAGHAA